MQRHGLARFVCLTVLIVAGFAVTLPVHAQETCQDPPPAGSFCDPSPGINCCDPADEPIHPDAQFCPNGYACCEGGGWRCNDDTGLSTCTTAGPVCERCCDPTQRPSEFDCDEGATCCADGSWRCNSGDGSSTCPREGAECPLHCCDPRQEPGAGGNPPCIEGATCCSTGDWTCNAGDGSPSCAIESAACEECCSPFDEPGRHGNAPCIEGTTCCSTGDWTCNAGDGSSTCHVEGIACERCCDPRDQPGRDGNPPCADNEEANCCTSGDWECNDPVLDANCNPDGKVCADRCCDPRDAPGNNGHPPCIEGATCCGDGSWACNDGSGGSTCEVPGLECEQCCDPLREPGAFGNPTCFEGATCCGNGAWQCKDAMGGSTCQVDGPTCDRCCDPADEPGVNGNSTCFEGATCCASGRWECNDATGVSTCALDGAPCAPACCDGDDRPNEPGNPHCATGFQCCDDGQWLCNDLDGNPTCDGDISAECVKRCGGIAGIPCDEDEFCKFEVGECCCDQIGVCMPFPDACPTVFDPVCGCDGQTYPNECLAERAGVSIEHRGACEGQVCGGFQGLECPEGQFCVLEDGECCCDFEGTCRVNTGITCEAVWDPVCGCDGNTYSNRCEALAAGVNVEHPGACQDPTREVEGLHFTVPHQVRWEPEPDALAYNLYLMRFDTLEPSPRFWRCVYSGIHDSGTTFPANPARGQVWWVQVSAVFEGGEGTLGTASDGTPRGPIAHCTCTLPAEPGPCEAAIPRWYHNVATGECEPFTYGGCEGNENNYETKAACEAACTDSCKLPAEHGDCDAVFRRWFHDPLTSQCFPFIWGGCGGNSNNFETRAECQQACDDVCALPADVGPCDGVFPRWYHNADSGECEEFVWGGCDGNGNNFESLPECQRACDDVCALPPEAGPCTAAIERWYHDDESGQCETFVWGGCGGNANNFLSKSACENRCP